MLKDLNRTKNPNKGSKFVETNRTHDNFVIEGDADYIEDEEYDECEHDYYHQNESIAMIPAFMGQALDIAKLIIENKVRNSEKISDKDIYQIHRNSFKHVISIFDEKN